MNRWIGCVLVLVLGIPNIPEACHAADLSKIDRTIVREPVYQSKQPRYCLLVFGPQAQTRIWLVLDGDTLYVDNNGNGDLTEADEKFQGPVFQPSDHPAHAGERSIEAGNIEVGGLTHTRLEVSQTHYHRKVDPKVKDAQVWQDYLDRIYRQIPDGIAYEVSIGLSPKCYGAAGKGHQQPVQHFAWLDEGGHLVFASRPQQAPVLHFGGSLILRVHHVDKLVRGIHPGKLSVFLGTKGIGPGSFVFMCYNLVPLEVHPVVEVRFPPAAPGGETVRRKYVLKERC